MTAHLTVEQRQLARRLDAKGLSLREVARQVGCSHEVVRTVVRLESKRPVRSQPWQPEPGRLTLADREEISLGMRAGASFTAIAASLGKAVSTISREVARNGGRTGYRAWRAEQQCPLLLEACRQAGYRFKKAQPRSVLTPPQIETALRLRREGASLESIALSFGVSS